MLKKAVIPAAGLGTRLLTATKEIPKELLPVFDKGFKGGSVLKPMLQIVFERLYDAGFREFCFIVGRGKKAVADHFTKDEAFIGYLRRKSKEDIAEELEDFYRKLAASKIVMVSQPEPKGFGDAVAKAEVFTSDEPFLVHAGDDLILSRRNSHINRLLKVFEEKNADSVLFVHRVQDPSGYGVITGVRVRPGLYRVTDIIEKPKTPPSNLAAIASYTFRNAIYETIRNTEADENGEVQLTDAIKQIMLAGGQVYAVELSSDEKRIDIGNVESYWDALRKTFQHHKARAPMHTCIARAYPSS